MGLLDLDIDIKPWLDIAPTNLDYDELLLGLNDIATDYIETYTNRVIEEQDLTHRFSGKGDHMLMLREFPVSQVTRVAIDAAWDFLTPEASTDYQVDNDAFLFHKNVWPQGIKNIEVSYTAGFAPDDIPEDIRQAALLLVEFLYHGRNDHRLGISNRSKVSENLTFQESIPKSITDLLTPYKRVNAVKDLLERAGG